MQLQGRTALVTGASAGLGTEFATQLAAAGADLVLVARRTERLEKLRATLSAEHPDRTIDVISADLAEPGAGTRLAAELAGHTIDVLVNNAGVATHGPFAELDAADSVSMAQLNVVTLTELAAAFLPGMVTAGRGAVINLASTAAFQPIPALAVYAATKAYVLSFTESLWWETRGTGVRVFALCPGATETEFFERTGKEFLTRGRMRPEDVVATALAALDGSGPTVVPGVLNKVGALGYRFAPRRILPMFSAFAASASD